MSNSRAVNGLAQLSWLARPRVFVVGGGRGAPPQVLESTRQEAYYTAKPPLIPGFRALIGGLCLVTSSLTIIHSRRKGSGA